MSTAIKNALLRAASNELSNQPVVKRLFQELIDNIAGLGPGGGDVVWVNDFFVDPVGGNDATAVPGSLKFTYKTLQKAFDAAGATITAGAKEATVFALPGTYDLGPTGTIVWPNVPGTIVDNILVGGINFVGLGGSSTTLVTNGGSNLIGGTVNVANFRGSITGVRLNGDNSINFFRAGAGTDGEFVLRDVVLDRGAYFTGFNSLRVIDVDDPATNAEIGVVNCSNVRCESTSLGGFTVDRDDGGICVLDFRVCSFRNDVRIGSLVAYVEAQVTIDRGTSFGDFFFAFLDGANYSIQAQGTLGTVNLDLKGAAKNTIKLAKASWRGINVTTDGSGGLVAPWTIDAQGSQAAFVGVPGTGVGFTLAGNVDLDVRGMAGKLTDTFITLSGGATLDRDWFGHLLTGVFGPGGGSVAVPFPALPLGAEYVVDVEIDTAGAPAVAVPWGITAKSSSSYTLVVGPTAESPTFRLQGRRRAS